MQIQKSNSLTYYLKLGFLLNLAATTTKFNQRLRQNIDEQSHKGKAISIKCTACTVRAHAFSHTLLPLSFNVRLTEITNYFNNTRWKVHSTSNGLSFIYALYSELRWNKLSADL